MFNYIFLKIMLFYEGMKKTWSLTGHIWQYNMVHLL